MATLSLQNLPRFEPGKQALNAKKKTEHHQWSVWLDQGKQTWSTSFDIPEADLGPLHYQRLSYVILRNM